MQTALAMLEHLGRIVVVVFAGQRVLRQILVEFGVAPVKKWAHLKDAIAAAGDDIERVAKRGLSLAKIGKPQITAVLAHGTLKRLQLDLLGKSIMLWIVDPGYAAHHHVSMRGALARYVQRHLQIELRDQLLGVAIGGRCVVTRICLLYTSDAADE